MPPNQKKEWDVPSYTTMFSTYTFIADDRFQAFFVEATDTWTLQVKYVQARDAGQYECQVSTEPKMSHFITLNVVGKILENVLLVSTNELLGVVQLYPRLIVEGRVKGKRPRQRYPNRWVDQTLILINQGLYEAEQLAQDREGWREIVKKL
ncbi:unnamed protein product [Diabrotica balteata]|uniref:Ig-like domain-containing protein n=1 Tax=Diabrotica balteata TaxID=107213 RepID=A0A9N9XB85_DIABA|nr:unnamed protein product [Diabrotica balteata]